MNRISAKTLAYRVCIVGIFALVFFAGDRCLAAVLKWVLMQSQFRYVRVYRGHEHPDILVLGNSHAVNSFFAPEIERLTGLRVLNLSYNGISASVGEVLLSDYFAHNPPPKLLIVEASWVASDNQALKDLRLFAECSQGIADLYAQNFPKAARFDRWFHTYRYNNEMFLRTLNYWRASDQDWVNRYRMNPDLLRNFDAATDAERRWPAPPADQLEAFHRVLLNAVAHGCEVRVVFSPHHPIVMSKAEPFSQWQRAILQSVPGALRVYDYSQALSETVYFADLSHLNYDGNLVLMPKMVKDGLFRLSPAVASVTDKR